MSDLGKLSYRSYWQYVLLKYIDDNPNTAKGQLTLDQLCNKTAIKPEDAISTLQHMSMVRQWKGQLVLYFTRQNIDERLLKYTSRNYGSKVCIDEYLTWSLPTNGYDLPDEKVEIDVMDSVDGKSVGSEVSVKEPPQKKVKR